MVIRTLIRLLEGMFIVGMVGSALVVLLTTFEDIKEFLLPKRNSEHTMTNDDNRGPPVG
jgi:hypothetical protein